MTGHKTPYPRPFEQVQSLDFTNVSKRYKETYAVRDLTFSVIEGEIIVLIGGSGSGKTTTLRMINRLIEPDSGEIRINGSNIISFNPIALRRSIGYVIQQIGLFPHMSVAENIAIPLTLEKNPPEAMRKRVDELLLLVSLSPDQYRDRRPSELSGGQQQRVGLARALASDPPLLLMDEPFGALDPLLRRQLQKEFVRIKKSLGKTILFVTHDIDEALLLGDRIAVFQDGLLHTITTPSELLVAAQSDPYLSYLTGGDRDCRIMSAKVAILAAKPGETIISRHEHEALDLQDAVRRKELRAAIISPPDAMPYAFVSKHENPAEESALCPVVRFTETTTIQEALIRFSQASAPVAILSDPSGDQIILLEDLITFLCGAEIP